MSGEPRDVRHGPGNADVVGTWLHSYEEDSGTTAVYRPEHHPFPPSRRPRRGLRFQADGTCTELLPGPADRPAEAAAGRWRRQEDGGVRVSFHRCDRADLTVVPRAGDVLTVEKSRGPGAVHSHEHSQ